MYNNEEIEFIQYWEQNRLKKKKVLRQLSVGLPLSVVLVMAIFVNFFSGWYKRADMALRSGQSSLVFVLIVAALLIVVFVVIFSSRHRWDMNEQRYKELLSKKDQ